MSATPLVMRDADIRDVMELVAEAVEGVDGTGSPVVTSAPATQSFTASIVIRGAPSAVVTIVCSRRLGTHIASLMFGTQEVTDVEIRDALGEVVNMVGGNLKALLPQAASTGRLSLPEVEAGAVVVPGAKPTNQLQLAWGDEAMTVSVFPLIGEGTPTDE